MDIKRIVVPYDGSTASQKALEWALCLGSKLDSEVIALMVVEPPSFSSSVDEVAEYYEEGEKQCKQILSDVCCNAEKKYPKFKTETLQGHAAESVVRYVYENLIDMIVIGSHGVGGLRGFLHTSVSTKIINYTTIPVVVIREEERN